MYGSRHEPAIRIGVDLGIDPDLAIACRIALDRRLDSRNLQEGVGRRQVKERRRVDSDSPDVLQDEREIGEPLLPLRLDPDPHVAAVRLPAGAGRHLGPLPLVQPAGRQRFELSRDAVVPLRSDRSVVRADEQVPIRGRQAFLAMDDPAAACTHRFKLRGMDDRVEGPVLIELPHLAGSQGLRREAVLRPGAGEMLPRGGLRQAHRIGDLDASRVDGGVTRQSRAVMGGPSEVVHHFAKTKVRRRLGLHDAVAFQRQHRATGAGKADHDCERPLLHEPAPGTSMD